MTERLSLPPFFGKRGKKRGTEHNHVAGQNDFKISYQWVQQPKTLIFDDLALRLNNTLFPLVNTKGHNKLSQTKHSVLSSTA